MNVRRFTDVAAGVVATLALVFIALLAIALQPKPTPSAEEIATEFGLEIVWMDETFDCEGEEAWGCFRDTTPDIIYVATGLSDELERYVILHETGHAMHHRLGIESTECAADQFARSLGGQSPRDYC